jgi:hypothetical protein
MRTSLVRLALLFLSATSLRCAGCEDGGVSTLRTRLEIRPERIDLGDVPLGVRVSAAVTLRNTGEARIELRSVELEDTSLFAIVAPPARVLEPAASDTVLLEATPSVLGEFITRLVIESDEAEAPTRSVDLRLRAVPPPPCDDGNRCTEDWFEAATNECRHRFADGVPCQAADRCIIDAVCSQGVCLGRSKACDDESACTLDFCRQTDGECVHVANPRACDDENPCTVDTCRQGACRNAPLANGAACEDGDLCTRADSCFAGRCVGSGQPDGSACDDGDSCTVGDVCSAGVCRGQSLIEAAAEGQVIFEHPLAEWEGRAFLHRREVSLSDDGVFFGLDHLSFPEDQGLTHVIGALAQCGTSVYEFSYRPNDTQVLVAYVRRTMQVGEDGGLRMVVGVRQRPQDGWDPQTTTYVLDPAGNLQLSALQSLGGEVGRSLLPDGSHIFATIWPLTRGAPAPEAPSKQNLVIAREDVRGGILWRHERATGDWAEFLGVAGPRVLFWSEGRFAALDFNTGAPVWSQPTAYITKEMALSTSLNLGVARATNQLIGVRVLDGAQVFAFPPVEDPNFVPRTDPVIAADGRILVLMEVRDPLLGLATGLTWVELDADGRVLSQTPLPYTFPPDWMMTRHEDWDDPYPTVADDGVAYVGYGDSFWALDPGGAIRWTLTSTVPSAFTGTVPLLREDGVLLISKESRKIIGVRTNGGQMSASGWASFRHDGRRTNHTP